MKRLLLAAFPLAFALAGAPALSQPDEEGCKDHPPFTRFPGTYLSGCESGQFDHRKLPVGPMKPEKEVLDTVDVEGPGSMDQGPGRGNSDSPERPSAPPAWSL